MEKDPIQIQKMMENKEEVRAYLYSKEKDPTLLRMGEFLSMF